MDFQTTARLEGGPKRRWYVRRMALPPSPKNPPRFSRRIPLRVLPLVDGREATASQILIIQPVDQKGCLLSCPRAEN